MDLSLDDFIKANKISAAPNKKFVPRAKQPLHKLQNRVAFRGSERIVDARNKIIQNNRAKIRDARDKLVAITRSSGDARKKLQQKQLSSAPYGNGKLVFRNERASEPTHTRKPSGSYKPTGRFRTISNGKVTRANPLPDLIDIPRGYVDYDNMERMEEEEYAAASRLSRTVKNDMLTYDTYDTYDSYLNSRPEPMSPPPTRRLDTWGGHAEHDPFDVYSRHERQLSPELPPPPPKGILRASGRNYDHDEVYPRRYQPDLSSHLSYEMRTRLQNAPDPNVSMGIFANAPKPPSSSSGYRIVVSNLQTSVTQSDIKELFGDIGELYDSRIVRPGVAEVIYKSLSDAEAAVENYHNRQLDGQPMKCMLVNPRASNKPTAPALKPSSSSRHNSGKTSFEIDIDALHKVLFNRD